MQPNNTPQNTNYNPAGTPPPRPTQPQQPRPAQPYSPYQPTRPSQVPQQPVQPQQSVQPQQPAQPEPTQKPKQKHTARNVILIILAVLLLACGGLAIWYFCFYNTPSKALSDAFTNFISADKIQLDLTAEYATDGAVATDKLNVVVKATNKTPVSVSGSYTTTASATNQPYTLTADTIFDQSGQLYVKLGGFSDYISASLGITDTTAAKDALSAIDTVAEATSEITGSEIATGTATAATAATTILDSVESLESTWWNIDLNALSADVQLDAATQSTLTNVYNCAFDAFRSVDPNTLADYYKAHPFVTINKYSGNLASSDFSKTAYTITLNSQKLADAINNIGQLGTYENFATCVNKSTDLYIPRFESDAQVSAEDIDAVIGEIPALVATVTNFGHQLTALAATTNFGNTTATYKLAISYPETLNITTPTEYRPISDATDTITEVVNYVQSANTTTEQ